MLAFGAGERGGAGAPMRRRRVLALGADSPESFNGIEAFSHTLGTSHCGNESGMKSPLELHNMGTLKKLQS